MLVVPVNGLAPSCGGPLRVERWRAECCFIATATATATAAAAAATAERLLSAAQQWQAHSTGTQPPSHGLLYPGTERRRQRAAR